MTYTVIVAEDEELLLTNLVQKIQKADPDFLVAGTAQTGDQALALVEKLSPDLVITDIRMPFMDGLELCKLVKKELPNIKILILSGYDEFDYAKEAIRLGVTEYLLKPISSGKLLEALNGVSESIRREKEDWFCFNGFCPCTMAAGEADTGAAGK